jgi:putative NIF3 family GTP cyclohydrolase 1 type 2
VADRDAILSHLDELLEVGAFDDYGPNGLQVPGTREVSFVATGVSAHQQLFERAAEAGAQLVICHHGIFWDSHPRVVTPQLKGRLPPSSRRTSRWRPTTSRSTPTPRSATTR